MRISALSVLTLLCVIFPHVTFAHVGPPFPILVDQPVDQYSVTIWADPDIGEALFYVVLEQGKKQGEKLKVQEVANVSLWVEPVNGRLQKAVYPATREPARGHLKFVAQPEFDIAEFWKVGVDIRLADGSTHSLLAQVESTPPGLGPWDLLIYLFPFVLFGGLWAMVFIRRTRARSIKARSALSQIEFAGRNDPAPIEHA